MSEPMHHHIPGETDHWQTLYLFDAASEELVSMDDHHVLQLFRAANLAVARVMIEEAPASLKFLSDYLDKADFFGDELQRRHNARGRK